MRRRHAEKVKILTRGEIGPCNTSRECCKNRQERIDKYPRQGRMDPIVCLKTESDETA